MHGRTDLLKGAAERSELMFGDAEFEEKLRIAGIWTALNCFDVPVQRPDGTFFMLKKLRRYAEVAH
jgi:hypothetical protein